MKHFYFLILLFCINSFANESFDSYILKKEGTKISINPSFFRIDSNEKFVFYKLENSDVEKKISFKDFDYILIGKIKFKTFKLNNSKEINGYFILCETASKSLIVSSSSDEESETMHYVFYIIDQDTKVVDNLEFDNLKKTKSAEIRADIFLKIQFYFKDCNALMDRLYSFDKDSAQNSNLNILGFFDSPVYIECL
ncbi:hypothetical protein [Flavobacterium daemonense]|uniref:hypothetical protein n=1 Tax=Flavobacterium daemonense TaxID=1393049 RepID=UPI0011862D6B|nr:hypothetical protein [Flavobacterium daemonense]KAF2336479.1 hypothetical protein FND99_04145 [Flavobacterium daemonense]